MKASAMALGMSVLALALPGTAAADKDGAAQSTSRSVGSAQVGSANVSAPARVASPGSNSSSASGGSSSQATSRSVGSAQVGSASASAPVRVASPGGNSSGYSSSSGYGS